MGNVFRSIHDVASLPLQVAAALYLLYLQLHAAAAAGIAIAVALIPANHLLATAVSRASAGMLRCKDARLAVMVQWLSQLRTVAMLGWQDVIVKQVWISAACLL